MSLLGQINIVHNVGRIRSIGQAPFYVKGLTYDRLCQQFERPHHALGNRYRNPIARVCDRILIACNPIARVYDRILIACRSIFSLPARIEIAIRIRPE